MCDLVKRLSKLRGDLEDVRSNEFPLPIMGPFPASQWGVFIVIGLILRPSAQQRTQHVVVWQFCILRIASAARPSLNIYIVIRINNYNESGFFHFKNRITDSRQKIKSLL
jgi:hypothetical protein